MDFPARLLRRHLLDDAQPSRALVVAPWWMQPNQPEKPKKEPNVEEVELEAPEPLSEEGKRKAWRMLSLIDAFRKVHTDPLSLDDIDLLGRVASGSEDLHDACAALRNGCTLDFLVIIFAD